jgi:rhodanese-related sulfurtransferase
MLNYLPRSQSNTTDYQAVLSSINAGEAQLVDIREKLEWYQFNIQGAIHLPQTSLSPGIGIKDLKELRQSNKKIFFHCLSGSRVQMAKQMLAAYGCTEFEILPTSMQVLAQSGFELVS